MQNPNSEPAIDTEVSSHAGSRPPDSAITILQHACVTSEPNLYVLGSYEGRVTIHSQQIRALNLLFALKSAGKLHQQGQRVAVIGGGIGGMTAAVAAAKLDANVTIFERHTEFLHNLRGCHTRHLHPNIYDWPSEKSLENKTNLPFLNWTADTADRVAIQLLSDWQSHVGSNQIDPRPNVAVMVRKAEPDGKRRITVTSDNIEELFFDIVILAVGFGVERSISPQPLRSYWRDDSLHQPEIEVRTTETKYLVSGNGDGALIDILRLRLIDFRHEDLVKDFSTEGGGLQDVMKVLEANESAVRYADSSGENDGKTINTIYGGLAVPSEFDEYLKSRLRKDTKVIFNYQDWPFSSRSSIFHRFLVSRLLKIDKNINVLPGQLIAVEGHEPNLVGKFQTDSGLKECGFERLVVRHGPKSAIERDFAKLNEQFEPILRPRNGLDSTRIAIWPENFFGAPVDTQSTSNTNIVSESDQNTNAPIINEDSSAVVSANARLLRDSLLNGHVSGLENKLSLLSQTDKNFILNSLVEVAMADEQGLNALNRFLKVATFDARILNPYMTQIVNQALFHKSVSRKTKVLELGTNALSTVNNIALTAFFAELLEIVGNDQFNEVNLIVPQLVNVPYAIPDTLYSRYVIALMSQSRSGSRQGAPAAQRALDELPEGILNIFFANINSEMLTSFWIRTPLKKMLAKYLGMVPTELQAIAKDLLELSDEDFDQKYCA